MLLVVLFVVSRIFTVTGHMMTYPIRRTIGILLFLLFITGVLIVFIEDSNWLRYTLAAYYGIGALCLLGLMAGLRLVKPIYMIHDYVCGHLLFIPLFILGALQLPRHIQSWLLYHNALSSNVVVSDILRYARKTQENMAGVQAADEDLVEQIAELKKIVQKQEIALQSAGLLGEQSPNAVANLVSSASEDYVDPTPQTQQPAQRTLSMSGMDVWGDMALGDVAPSVGNEQFRPQTSQPPPPPQAPSSSGDFSFAQPEQPPPR
jgi:callose synthase